MVRSTTRYLRKMIGQAKFNYDELLTAVIEVEAIINFHPLSYVSADNLEEPLTPSHLLAGRRLLSLPENLCHQLPLDDEDFEVTPAHLNKGSHRYSQGSLEYDTYSNWRRGVGV